MAAVFDGSGSLLKPGTPVKVTLNFTGSFAQPNQAKAKELLQASLADRGLKLVASGKGWPRPWPRPNATRGKAAVPQDRVRGLGGPQGERSALPRYMAKTADGVQALPESFPLTASGVGPPTRQAGGGAGAKPEAIMRTGGWPAIRR